MRTAGVVKAAGAIRALFARRRIVLFHLPEDLKIGIVGVALIAQEQRLFSIRDDNPAIVLEIDIAHISPPSLDEGQREALGQVPH
ncbi:hypothetical protein GCM10007908_12550 [Rhizobium albus]|nr:hypothetical protein GCM10007908_12550 [Rhizobium albus]